MLILVINPGSTSTKMAVFEDEKPMILRGISHTNEELAPFGDDVLNQMDYRKQLVLDELKRMNVPMQFEAVIGRGGLVKPIAGGVYEINQQMIDDTLNGIAMHNHACNLGCLIAHDIAQDIPGCRSIARRFANEIGRRYEDLNLIICHLGGGISVAAHEHGRAVDANNALDGEGPFSPERAGSLPASDLIRLSFSGKYTEKQLLKRLAGKAGLNAHLGTSDVKEIEQRITAGDKHAETVLNAMIYHVAKNICALGAVFCGKVDAILLTGGLARSQYVISRLRQRIEFLAPTYCFPGEDEMEALALNALAVLRGQREVLEYA